MELTRKQIIDIHGVLGMLSQKEMRPKGAYAVGKNKRIAESELNNVKEVQQNMKFPEGFDEFEKKRVELCEEYSNKDEEGNAKKIGGQRYDIPVEKMEEFEKAVDELRVEYKEDLDEKDRIIKEFQDLLDEPIEIEFHKMKLEWLPDKISGTHMEVLMDLIDEG